MRKIYLPQGFCPVMFLGWKIGLAKLHSEQSSYVYVLQCCLNLDGFAPFHVQDRADLLRVVECVITPNANSAPRLRGKTPSLVQVRVRVVPLDGKDGRGHHPQLGGATRDGLA